jgi:hypothetical protein
MTSDGPAPAHSITIGVPSADATVEIDVCTWLAAAMVPTPINTATARIGTPSLIDSRATVLRKGAGLHAAARSAPIRCGQPAIRFQLAKFRVSQLTRRESWLSRIGSRRETYRKVQRF